MTSASIGLDQPRLIIAQAPSNCRLCNVELDGTQTWRQHVKSAEHVYELQSKTAGPERRTTHPPALSSVDDSSEVIDSINTSESNQYDTIFERNESIDSDTEDETPILDFDSKKCLFCGHGSDGLDHNMTHMASAHGFSVPFQDCLAVQLEELILYLQFVIYGYRECICCSTRRSTVEGVQQHMQDKGHCRFEVTEDTEEFYELIQSGNALNEQMQRDSSTPVRLPSGKLVAHRKHLDVHGPRTHRRPTSERNDSPFTLHAESSSAPSVEIVNRPREGGSRDVVRSSEAILATQLSKLRIASDRAQLKLETRKRGKLERARNIIMTKNFRTDSSDGRSDPRY